MLAKLRSFGSNVFMRTITLFTSDHGYHLGEQNMWAKMTDTELATRMPLIIRVPWKAASRGKRTKNVVELVDLYRTLADLAGLGNVQGDVQGVSLGSLFDAPTTKWVNGKAYSQIGSCGCGQQSVGGWHGLMCGGYRCMNTPVQNFQFMGYSVRSYDGWRYTAWLPMNPITGRVNWAGMVSNELFDLRGDISFDHKGQSVNVADQYPDRVHAMRNELEQTMRLNWY